MKFWKIEVSSRLLSIVFAAALLLPCASSADPLDLFWTRNPYILGDFPGVAFGNGRFLAPANQIYASTDGLSWNSASSGWGFNTLSFANGLFFGGLGYGQLASSMDGTNWTYLGWAANASIRRVVRGGSLYVAVTYQDFETNNIVTSSDGITWTPRKAGAAQDLNGLTYGGGIFLAAGNNGAIVTSANGITWTARASSTAQSLYGVTYGNGLFVAVGASGTIISSPDGLTWTAQTSGTSYELHGVCYANGLWVAVGTGGTILTSPDGSAWTTRAPVTVGSLGDVAFGNGIFVAAGTATSLVTSANGMDWVLQSTTVTSQRLTSVCYGTSNYVAVGFAGTVLTSTNGATWTNRTSGTSLGLYSVAYANGLFVAVGQIILSSPDGITWTVRDSGANYDYEAVGFVNGVFAAVGANGAIKVSANGLTWSARSSGTTATLYGLAYGNGLYVVVGAGGVIRTSSDGASWTARTSGTSQDLNGVTFGGGLFVVQGNGGVVLTSTNGLNWTSRSTGAVQGLTTCAYGFGRYVIVGQSGVLLTSSDGVNWVMRNWFLGSYLNIGVVAGPDSFVVVGDYGQILQSDLFPPLGIARQPQNQIAPVGSSALFTVEPWGAAPLAYQWRKNGINQAGATSNPLTLTNIQFGSAGQYSVVVSNASGVASSSNASLTVVPLLISPQPQDQIVTVGGTASFTPGVVGTGPFSYQWRKEGYPILGVTNLTYSFGNAQLSNAGAFTLVASNAYGAATSSVARLTVTTSSQVSSILLFHDSTVTSPYEQTLISLGRSYQLLTTDAAFATALNSANGPTTLAIVDAVDYTHDFSALVSFINRGGRVLLEYWNLSAGTVATACQVSISSIVYCPPPLYDWGGSPFFSGLSSPETLLCLAGVNGQTLQPTSTAYAVAGFVNNPTANQAAIVVGNNNRTIVNGFLAEDCITSADANRIAQNEIQFLLGPPPLAPVVTFQPFDQQVMPGQSASFSVVGNGSGILRYRWFFNQTNLIASATNTTLTIANVQNGNTGSYSVSISNAFGAATSRLASLSLPVPPSIVGQPQSQTVRCGGNAMFVVNASGTAPLTYQWRKNGTLLVGATNSAYVATPITCQAPENYTVVITNVAGAITSSPVTLAVVDTNPPVIICSTNLMVSAGPGQCSAMVVYSLNATDDCAVVSLAGNPPSGSTFPKGTNSVLCTAIDCAGNSNTCSFNIVVLESDPPSVTCPTNQTVACLSSNGVQVFFSTTALDNCDGPLPVICTPASGSSFVPGTTTVNCFATDASGNSSNCSFTITAVLTNAGILPPTASLHGRSYAEWSAAWWAWNFSLPATNHPLLDTGDASLGQSGPVWFLGGVFGTSGTNVRSATIPQGTAVFLPIVNAWADNANCPNPDNFTEAQLRIFARSIQDQAHSMFCNIDGVPVAALDDATNTPYRVQSPVFDYLLPAAHNLLYDVLGATCYSNSAGTVIPVTGAVADGIFLLLPDLAAGNHTIHFHGAVGSGFVEDITYHLTVAPNLGNATVFPPAAKFAGKSYGDWSAAWWQWCFSLPTGGHPLFETADASAGQNGPVWFLGGTFGSSGTRTRTVTIPDGKYIFFPILNNMADNADCPNPDQFTESELRAIAQANQDRATNLSCTIDGVNVLDLSDPIGTPYRVTSPVFGYTIPGSDSLLAYLGLSCYTNDTGAPIPVNEDAVADGVFLMLPPLLAGEHTLHFYGAIEDPPSFFDDITYHITITPPRLSISGQSNNVVLSWPQTADPYVLEESSRVSPADWAASSSPITVSAGHWQARIPVSGPCKFFRIKAQTTP